MWNSIFKNEIVLCKSKYRDPTLAMSRNKRISIQFKWSTVWIMCGLLIMCDMPFKFSSSEKKCQYKNITLIKWKQNNTTEGVLAGALNLFSFLFISFFSLDCITQQRTCLLQLSIRVSTQNEYNVKMINKTSLIQWVYVLVSEFVYVYMCCCFALHLALNVW